MIFIIFAGTPPTTEQGGTSFVTTELAATIAQKPMCTPGKIHTRSPIHTLSSIITGPFDVKGRLIGGIDTLS